MAVYNGEKFLPEALDSLACQTYPADEVIIVNDASTDGTEDILSSFNKILPLRIISNKVNRGLTRSLINGWKEARGCYIARMDADDISFPRRFERQIKQMERIQTLGICGTWGKILGVSQVALKFPKKHEEIQSYICWGNPFIHSSVMLRRAFFDTARLQYNPLYAVAQDYDLWERALASGIKAINLPNYLVGYRTHEGNITNTQRGERYTMTCHVMKRALNSIGIPASESDLELHHRICQCELDDDPNDIAKALNWLQKLAISNSKKTSMPYFTAIMKKIWFAVCYHNAVVQNSKYLKIYLQRNHFDPLGYWRLILIGALLKKKIC